jgi:DNA-binding MarR family transcriptional regulator
MGRVPTRDGEPNLSYVVARLERAVRREINERVRPHGLTTAQYTTLSILGRGRPLSNAQLARRAYMTPQSMSETIEALETRALIKRRASPEHRRVLPATLTAPSSGLFLEGVYYRGDERPGPLRGVAYVPASD